MSNVYKIAVALQMTSNAPAFLSMLSSKVLGVHVGVKKLEGAFNRLHVAIGGGAAVMAGSTIIRIMKDVGDNAKELTKNLTALQNFHIPQAQIVGIDQLARATALGVRGSTEASNLGIATQAYSMFGVEGVRRLMPELAKFAVVQGSITGDYDGAKGEIYSLLKSSDLMGKFVNPDTHKVDIDRLDRYLDLVAKVEAGTHGKVDPATLLQLAKQGGASLSTLDDNGLMTMFMASQGLGGFRAGTALMSSFRQFVGGRMTEPMAAELKKMGLIGDYKVGRGGHVLFSDKSLDTEFGRDLAKDPLLAADYLMQVLKQHGIKDTDAQIKELFKMLGQQTEIRLFSDLMRNNPQMHQERARLLASAGINDQYSADIDHNLSTAEYDLGQAWKNLMQAVAGPNASLEISIINKMADAINWLTTKVNQMDPKTLQDIAVGIGVLGVALVGGGAVALIAALGPVGWVAAGLIALGVAVAAFKMDALKQIGAGFMTVWDGIKHLDVKEIISGIGKVWSGEFALLPNMVQDSIHKAIFGIGDYIRSEFGRFLNWMHIGSGVQHSSYTGGVPEGAFIKASLNDQASILSAAEINRARRAGVPASINQTITINNTMTLDGKEIAKSVTRRQVKLATMPTSVSGGPDLHGTWIGPGTTLQPV